MRARARPAPRAGAGRGRAGAVHHFPRPRRHRLRAVVGRADRSRGRVGDVRRARPPRRSARGRGVSPEALAQAANHYVRVRGTPDRESALELDTKGSWVFTQFFRILGTGEPALRSPAREPAARGARRGGPLRGAPDPLRRSVVRDARSASTSATHVIATHFFAPGRPAPRGRARAGRADGDGQRSRRRSGGCWARTICWPST